MWGKWWLTLSVMLLLGGTCSCQGQTSKDQPSSNASSSAEPASMAGTPTSPGAVPSSPSRVADASPEVARGLVVRSPAFVEGADIPRLHSCDGKDASPALSWTSPPAGTRSLAIVCDDPDAPAGTWVHWVAWNIPASRRDLPEHVPPQPQLPDGTRQGINDFKKAGYNGPCPPGGTHRYFFRVYALDVLLNLAPGATRAQLAQAMRGHVLAEGALMGRYTR